MVLGKPTGEISFEQPRERYAIFISAVKMLTCLLLVGDLRWYCKLEGRLRAEIPLVISLVKSLVRGPLFTCFYQIVRCAIAVNAENLFSVIW